MICVEVGSREISEIFFAQIAGCDRFGAYCCVRLFWKHARTDVLNYGIIIRLAIVMPSQEDMQPFGRSHLLSKRNVAHSSKDGTAVFFFQGLELFIQRFTLGHT